MFSQIAGLPLHPLVIHAVVVLVPLSALGALAVAVRPRWSRAYGPLVAAGAVVAAVSAMLAQRSGNALLAELGYTGDAAALLSEHGRWGTWVGNLSIAFAVIAVVAVVLDRRVEPGVAHRVVWWTTVVLGVATTVFTVLAGDTGARSSWGFVFARALPALSPG